MNIALITNNFLPNTGGISNVMVNVSKNLNKLGERVYVFNQTSNLTENYYFRVLSNDKTLKGIFIHHYRFFFFLFQLLIKILFFFKGINFKAKMQLISFYCFYPKFLVRKVISIRHLVSEFKKNKIDIILSGTADISLVYSYILAKWYNIPIVSIAHGDDFLRKEPFSIKKLIFNDIQKIVVTNKVMRDLFLKVYDINPKKLQIIHLGVDIENSEVKEGIDELRRNFNISLNEFIILTVSRFYPRKGFKTILEAIKSILIDDPSFPLKYLIIGGGEEEKSIKALINHLNLNEKVKLLGNVEDSIRNQIFKLSDLFILVPEVKKDSIEGFGIVYIEANYFRLPTIGSRSGGVRIAIEDGKSGFLVEPNNFRELKEKILLLYNNKQLRIDLGQYGHERVKMYFNWSQNAIYYRDLLKEVIKEYHNNLRIKIK